MMPYLSTFRDIGAPITVGLICGIGGGIEATILLSTAVSGSGHVTVAITFFDALPLPAIGLIVSAAAAGRPNRASRAAKRLSLMLNGISIMCLPAVPLVGHLYGL
jgi:DMSO reductase anchor subunit